MVCRTLLLKLQYVLVSSAPSVSLFKAGELGVQEYRIPLLLAVPPHNDTLLAFAEARLSCTRSCGHRSFWGDSSPKHVAFRRSTDAGKSWSPISFIVKSNGTNDNLNLGSAVWDSQKQSVLLHWGGCVHCGCHGTVPKPSKCEDPSSASAWQLSSQDLGATWSSPVDIGSEILTKQSPIWKFGEGSGVQLSDGTLVVCGRSSSSSIHGVANQGSGCMHSQNHGATWHVGAHGLGGNQDANECDLALLTNGSILLNMRAGATRLIARSDDGGRTFNTLTHATSLDPVANCQGSMIALPDGSGDLVFSGPRNSKHARANLSLALSSDEGNTWRYVVEVDTGVSEYSCIAPIAGRKTGILYEVDGYSSINFTTITLPS